MLLESAFHQLFCLKFSFKLVTRLDCNLTTALYKSFTYLFTFSKSCGKQKWMFFSEHRVYALRLL